MKKGISVQSLKPLDNSLMAEREGFEPSRQVLARLLDFQSSAFSQTQPPLRVLIQLVSLLFGKVQADSFYILP
jgi:hypothetical protein